MPLFSPTLDETYGGQIPKLKLLGSTKLAARATTITVDFSRVPGQSQLYCVCSIPAIENGAGTATADVPCLRFNGDSAVANYGSRWTGFEAAGVTLATGLFQGATVAGIPIRRAGTAAHNSSEAQVFSAQIHNPSSGPHATIITAGAAMAAATTAIAVSTCQVGGFWVAASQITSITVYCHGGNSLAAGTGLAVYGLPFGG